MFFFQLNKTFIFLLLVIILLLLLILAATLKNVVVVENLQAKISPIEKIYFARVTAYSPMETCGPCIMASGRYVYIGAIACPRAIPLGTKVEIGGTLYTCEDRTALWLEQQRGPTFDIFMWRYKDALNFGSQRILVREL